MKYTFLLMTALAIILIPFTADAQPRRGQAGGPAGGPPGRPPDFSMTVHKVKSTMKLSAEQESQISALLREYRSRKDEILGQQPEDSRAEDAPPPPEMRKLDIEMEQKLEQILTPDQLDKYNEIRRSAPGREAGSGMESMMRERMKMMTERLGLSRDQVEKLNPLMRERAEKMRVLFDRRRGSDPEKMRAEAEKIDMDLSKKLETILTPDQMTEYNKLREEEHDRMRARMRDRSPEHGSRKH